GVGLGGLVAVSSAVTLSSTAPTLALMIGLAVGIDYALFILSRHRSQLAAGMAPEESVARATGTAGPAVLLAGLPAVVALARRPVVTVGLVLAAIVVLALPAPKLSLALPDNSAAPAGSTQRIAYDLVSEHFGPGVNGPLVVLVDGLQPATAQQEAQRVAVAI